MNGGKTVTTGFARSAVLSHANEIVAAVKSGQIRHFFLVAAATVPGPPAVITPSLPSSPRPTP